ncbi:hypothetical protein GJ496_000078 [Pomphorhynchus laevis]|nr:hypothetical protein GJ496_000078 [Pomphorhynchus laevis]
MPDTTTNIPEIVFPGERTFEMKTHHTFWNLAYNLNAHSWDNLVPDMYLFEPLSNPYGVMNSLTRAMLESLAEINSILNSRQTSVRLIRLLELARGTPAKKLRITSIDYIYNLRDSLLEHFSKKKLMPWSVCGQFARRVLVRLSASSFSDLADILDDDQLSNNLNTCISENRILYDTFAKAKHVESGEPINTFAPVELWSSTVSPIVKLLNYIDLKDELATHRIIHEYFDAISTVPRFGDHHHQGIVGVALAELKLGRYEQADVSLNEALSRRLTANPNLYNLMFNLHNDWSSMLAYCNHSDIPLDLAKAFQPLSKTKRFAACEVPLDIEHRQLIYTRLVNHYANEPMRKFYSKLCIWSTNVVSDVEHGNRYLEQFNSAISQLNWRDAMNIADKTEYPILCKCMALLCRGDDLHKVHDILESSDLDKDDIQVQMLKCCLAYRTKQLQDFPTGHTFSLIFNCEFNPKTNKIGCHIRKQLIDSIYTFGDKLTKNRCIFIWAWLLLFNDDDNNKRIECMKLFIRAALGFNSSNEKLYQAKSWFLAAKLANSFNRIEERNRYSHQFRKIYESLNESDRLLFF